MSLLSLAMEIVWKKLEEMQRVIPLADGMHFLCLCHLYDEAGLLDKRILFAVFFAL